MIEIDGKIYRNLQEQVQKNMEDIEYLQEHGVSDAYTKEEADAKFETIEDMENYYTKSESEDLFALKDSTDRYMVNIGCMDTTQFVGIIENPNTYDLDTMAAADWDVLIDDPDDINTLKNYLRIIHRFMRTNTARSYGYDGVYEYVEDTARKDNLRWEVCTQNQYVIFQDNKSGNSFTLYLDIYDLDEAEDTRKTQLSFDIVSGTLLISRYDRYPIITLHKI